MMTYRNTLDWHTTIGYMNARRHNYTFDDQGNINGKVLTSEKTIDPVRDGPLIFGGPVNTYEQWELGGFNQATVHGAIDLAQ